jgi:hypothetical protein
MSEHADPMVQAAERLCATLERLGDALVELDTQTLLETEESLGQLLAALAVESSAVDKAALEPLVRRGRAALLRCQRLGASLTNIARALLPLRVDAEAYGCDGVYVEHAVSGSAVQVIV